MDAGAHGANNPTEIAQNEGERLDSAGYSYYIVSIGTGAKGLALDPDPMRRGKLRRTVNNMFNIHRRARELARGFARYATDTTAVEKKMETANSVSKRYVYELYSKGSDS